MVQRKDVRDSIEKYVKNRLPIDKDDLVLWVGSTATGLSNYYSDIDLIVVTPAVDRYPSNVFDGEVNIITLCQLEIFHINHFHNMSLLFCLYKTE